MLQQQDQSLSALEDQILEIQIELDDAKSLEDELGEEIEEAELELRAAQKEESAAKENAASLRALISEKRAEKASIVDTTKEIKVSKGRYQTVPVSRQSERDAVQTLIDDLEEQRTEVLRDARAAGERKSENKTLLRQLKQKKNRQVNRQRQLQRQLTHASSKKQVLDSKRASTREKHSVAAAGAASKQTELDQSIVRRGKLHCNAEERKAQIRQTKQRIASLEAAVQTHRDVLDQARHEMQAANTRVSEANHAVSQCKQSVDEAKGRITEARER